MKRIFFLFFAFGMFVYLQPPALAYTVTMDEAAFYVVDQDATSGVSLSITNISTVGETLSYSTDRGSSWHEVSSGEKLNFEDGELVYWKLGGDQSGTLYFSPDDGDNLYDTATIVWKTESLELSVIGAMGGDSLRPVPIGSSAMLLSSGMLGLLFLTARKRRFKE